MTARLYVEAELAAGQGLALPDSAARHVQVLRLQPGHAVVLFNGRGGEWPASIEHMGRREVTVRVAEHVDVDRELAVPVTLAVGMPANERFDWLIEKATELGVAAIEPLVCERSVVRTAAERAERKLAHWRGVAIAAAEQCGRTRVPHIEPAQAFAQWLKARAEASAGALWVLSFGPDAQPLRAAWQAAAPQARGVHVLSGPEGGLSSSEDQGARKIGAVPVSLGPRVLRAETAPLFVLAALSGGLENGNRNT